MRGGPALVRAALATLALAWASAPRALVLPGSTWGDFYWETPRPGSSDLVLEGWIRQGVGWARFTAGEARLTLQTYGTVRYKWDSLGLDWNNYVGPGAGVAIDLAAPGVPLVTLGAEYIYQWNTRSSVGAPYSALFLDWYHWWDLKSGDWPGSTWGALRWEVPRSGADDLILEGWLRQGRLLRRFAAAPLAFVLSAYLSVHYYVDTLGLDWNNYLGPGVGITLDVDGLRGLQPAIGIEYAWERNLASPGGTQRIDLVVRWYGWWEPGGR